MSKVFSAHAVSVNGYISGRALQTDHPPVFRNSLLTACGCFREEK